MNNEIKLTSSEWNSKLCKKLGVLHVISDPDGWDRANFSKSYYEEKVTKSEFIARLSVSTLIGSPLELTKALDEI